MYHHFGAVTNKRGDALPGFFVRVIDGSGNAVPLYSDSSATPIINVSGVADAALVDANGNADFWITEGTYTLQIYAADASTLYLTVPDLPFIYGPTGPTGAQGPAGDLAKCLTLSELASVASPTSGMTRYLALIGREGLFVFDSANHASNVSADPGQWLYVAPSSDTTGASGAWIRRSRAKLTADRTFYVDDGGNNANDGSTALLPMGSIQQAINVVYQVLDCNGFKVTIQVADGTYTTPITIEGQPLGASDANGQWLQIIGNEVTPANVAVSAAGNNALVMYNGARALVAGITWSAGSYGWLLSNGCTLEHRNCAFGNVTNDMILAQYHSTVRAVGPLTVNGNADSFVHATGNSRIAFDNQSIAFNNNVFTTYLWGLNASTASLAGCTITGTKTGGITVHEGANLQAGSSEYLGGSTPTVGDLGFISADNLTTRTFYVRTDGNDNNDGLYNTSGRAFKTIQAALDAVSKLTFDPVAYDPLNGAKIIVAAGTYAGVSLRDVKYSSATLQGDPVTPSNVVIAGTSDGISAIGVRTKWLIDGFTISAAAGECVRTEQGSQVSIQNIVFGSSSGSHISSVSGSCVIATGNYTISGSAARHIVCTRGYVDISSRTVTLTGTPAFSGAFAQLASNSALKATSVTFSGSATGTRYTIATCSSIDTNGGGSTYLPGSVTGTTSSGGQYA